MKKRNLHTREYCWFYEAPAPDSSKQHCRKFQRVHYTFNFSNAFINCFIYAAYQRHFFKKTLCQFNEKKKNSIANRKFVARLNSSSDHTENAHNTHVTLKRTETFNIEWIETYLLIPYS